MNARRKTSERKSGVAPKASRSSVRPSPGARPTDSGRGAETNGQPSTDATGLSGPDCALLGDFCRSIKLDDVSFEAWKNTHHELNIRIPLFVSADESQSGGVHVLRFSRTVMPPGSSGKCVREKVEIPFALPRDAVDGMMCCVSGQGDRRGDESGNLLITIHIRR